jgi:tripartite-type tricarboxylate transporter receptor subunit TctC
MQSTSIFAAALLAGACAQSPAPAQSEPYPQRPIRLIVGFTSGGATGIQREDRLIS